jgi:hypothetical protein
VQRLGVEAVQFLQEGGDEALLRPDGEAIEVDDRRPVPAGDQLGDGRAGHLVERHVAVLATEDHDRIRAFEAVG